MGNYETGVQGVLDLGNIYDSEGNLVPYMSGSHLSGEEFKLTHQEPESQQGDPSQLELDLEIEKENLKHPNQLSFNF